MAEEFSDSFYRRFPSDFRWGVATAAYQIEGAVGEDGRGPSIWDTFSHTPGRTHGGDTGDIACDHYHRYRDDVALMAAASLRHYRLSIAWPRIFPEGTGAMEARGLSFYDRLVDTLLDAGITPLVTLYHWDLPEALQARGGWLLRDTAEHFRDYALAVHRRLGDRVQAWITHNEPWCTAWLGHGTGEHAPGRRDPREALTVSHHVLLSHGQAARALHEAGAREVGIALNLHTAYPASQRPDDREAARLADVFQNRWFLDPLLRGAYPAELERLLGPWPKGVVRAGDLEIIGERLDFLGVNYYASHVIAADPNHHPVPGREVTPRDWVTEMNWPVMPQGLTDLLVRLSREYTDRPLYITENGVATRDTVEAGRVADPDRVRYLKAHLEAMAAALEGGARLRGYYVWSLMDNFEWGQGYAKRFGLIYVDYPSQTRIPKESWHWYRAIREAWFRAVAPAEEHTT
jgi:beta-glucosidase